MHPTSPVLIKAIETKSREIEYGSSQPQYIPLPGLRDKAGMITCCYQLDWRERLKLLLTGRLYLQQKTFHMGLHPIRPSVDEPLWTECTSNDPD